MSRRRIALSAAVLCAGLVAWSARSDEPKAAPKPGAEQPHITLTWSTASEVDNFGYFVMRGDDEKGPFAALNAKAIPGAGNSEIPRDYRYEDFAVTPGKTYFYYLESISTSGVKEKFSPILKRQCCKQTGATKSEDKKAEEKKSEEKKAADAAPAAEGKR